MTVNQVALSSDIPARLGDDFISLILDYLHAGDCQTCGSPLGSELPSFCAEVNGSRGWVSLHHQGCRASALTDGVLVSRYGTPVLTWEAKMVLVPLGAREAADYRLAMLINPGLEAVSIRRRGDGRWMPGTARDFIARGFQLAPKIHLDEAVPNVEARMVGDGLAVDFAPPERYLAPVDEANIEWLARTGPHVLVIATSAVRPAALTSTDELMLAVLHGEAAAGCVRIDRDDA